LKEFVVDIRISQIILDKLKIRLKFSADIWIREIVAGQNRQ